jgi:hypothetical protein
VCHVLKSNCIYQLFLHLKKNIMHKEIKMGIIKAVGAGIRGIFTKNLRYWQRISSLHSRGRFSLPTTMASGRDHP